MIGRTTEADEQSQMFMNVAVQKMASHMARDKLSDAEAGLSKETTVAQTKTGNYVLKSSVFTTLHVSFLIYQEMLLSEVYILFCQYTQICAWFC